METPFNPCEKAIIALAEGLKTGRLRFNGSVKAEPYHVSVEVMSIEEKIFTPPSGLWLSIEVDCVRSK